MNTQVQTAKTSPVDQFRATLGAMEAEFVSALPAEIPADKFIRIIMTAVQMDNSLLDADRRSLVGSCMKAAQDGLLLDGREAALIIFSKQVQYMPMVTGLYKKMRGKAGVSTISARVVYQKDHFSYVLGDTESIEHAPHLGKDRGGIVGAYAIAKLANGDVEREFMAADEIDDVKSVSRSGDKGPWGKWYGEMAKKTVIKRLAKRLPVIDGLGSVIEHDNEDYDLALSSSRAKDITPETERPKLSDYTKPARVYVFAEETGEVTSEFTSPNEYVEALLSAMAVYGVDFHALYEANSISIDALQDEDDDGFAKAVEARYAHLCKTENTANKKAAAKKNKGGASNDGQEPGLSSRGSAHTDEASSTSAPTTPDIDPVALSIDLLAKIAKSTDMDKFAQKHANDINDLRAAGHARTATDLQTAIKDRRAALAKEAGA